LKEDSGKLGSFFLTRYGGKNSGYHRSTARRLELLLVLGDEGAYLLPRFSLSPSGGEMFYDTLDKIAGRWDTGSIPETNERMGKEMKRYKLVDKEKFISRLMIPVFISGILLAFHDTLWAWSWIPTLAMWVYIIRNYRTGKWEL
jgi:hypothetical protein